MLYPTNIVARQFDDCRLQGIPFKSGGRSFTGADCWGVGCIAYKVLLQEYLESYSNEYDCLSPENHKHLVQVIGREAVRLWVPVAPEEVQPLDAIDLSTGEGAHVGFVVEKGRMLHIRRNTLSTIEPYTSTLYKNRVKGFYRYGKFV